MSQFVQYFKTTILGGMFYDRLPPPLIGTCLQLAQLSQSNPLIDIGAYTYSSVIPIKTPLVFGNMLRIQYYTTTVHGLWM